MPSQRKMGYTNKVYSSVKMYLDDILIRKGFFDSVASGEMDWQGNTLSQLFPNTRNDMFPADTESSVHVWEGYKNNWVSESGVVGLASGVSDPIVASGVYINDTFYPSSTISGAGDGVAIDFKRGRVIIESGIPSTYDVQVAHSFKEVWVDTIARDMIVQQIETTSNTPRSGVTNVPSGQYNQLPMVLMSLDNISDTKGLQLGAGIIMRPMLNFFIVANNRYDKDEILDTLATRQFKSIPMLNFNAISGQFDFYGDFDTNYQSYPTLTGTYKERDIFVEESNVLDNDDNPENNYYTAIVSMQLRLDIPEDIL
jgi:hypothetical protein